MGDIKILDGGLGTTLEDRYGVVFTHTKPLWSSHLLVSDPATLQTCQGEFCRAGADVLLTATYQVSIEAFAQTKTPGHPDGITQPSAMLPYLRRAVDIAEKAAAAVTTTAVPSEVEESGSGSSAAAEIALACGPYGASMIPGQEYTGAYDAAHETADALADWHAVRLALYGEAGADVPGRCAYVAFETVPSLAEIWGVRTAYARLPQRSEGGTASSDTGFPSRFWISCVFPHEDDSLADGSSVDQVVEAMLAPSPSSAVGTGGDGRETIILASPWGIGINCTKIYKLDGLIKMFEQSIAGLKSRGLVADVPTLVLYPDGTNGEIYNTTTKEWEAPATVRDAEVKISWDIQLAEIVDKTKQRGIFTSFLVGGCCKANPQNIQDLRGQFKPRN